MAKKKTPNSSAVSSDSEKDAPKKGVLNEVTSAIRSSETLTAEQIASAAAQLKAADKSSSTPKAEAKPKSKPRKAKPAKKPAPTLEESLEGARSSVAQQEQEASQAGYPSLDAYVAARRDALESKKEERVISQKVRLSELTAARRAARAGSDVGTPGKAQPKPNTQSPLVQQTFGAGLVLGSSDAVSNPGTKGTPGFSEAEDRPPGVGNTQNVGMGVLDQDVVDTIERAASPGLPGNAVLARLKQERSQYTWPAPVSTPRINTTAAIESLRDDPSSDSSHIDRVGKPIMVNGKLVGYTGSVQPLRTGEGGTTEPVPVRTADSSVTADEVARYTDDSGNTLASSPNARAPRRERLVSGPNGWLQNELGSEAMLRDRMTMGRSSGKRTLVYRSPATIPVMQGDKEVGRRIPGSNVAYDSDTGLPMPPEFHAGLTPEQLKAEPKNAYQLKSEVSQQGDTAYLVQKNEDGSIKRIIPPTMVRRGKVMTNTSRTRQSRLTKDAERNQVAKQAAESGNSGAVDSALDEYDQLQESLGPQFGSTASASGDIIKPYGKQLGESTNLDELAQGVGLVMPDLDPVPSMYVPPSGGIQRAREELAQRGVNLTGPQTAYASEVVEDTRARQEGLLREVPVGAPLGRQADMARSTRLTRGAINDPRVDNSAALDTIRGHAAALEAAKANQKRRRALSNKKTRLINSGTPEDHPDIVSITEEHAKLVKEHSDLKDTIKVLRSATNTGATRRGSTNVNSVFRNEDGTPNVQGMEEAAAALRLPARGQPPSLVAESNYRYVQALQSRGNRNVIETPEPFTEADTADVNAALSNVVKPTSAIEADGTVRPAEPPSEDAVQSRIATILTGPQRRSRVVKAPISLSGSERARVAGIAGVPSSTRMSGGRLLEAAALATSRNTGRLITAPLPQPVDNSAVTREMTQADIDVDTRARQRALVASGRTTPEMARADDRRLRLIMNQMRTNTRVGQLVEANYRPMSYVPGVVEPTLIERARGAQYPAATDDQAATARKGVNERNATVAADRAMRRRTTVAVQRGRAMDSARDARHQEWVNAGATPEVAATWAERGQSPAEAAHRWRQVAGGIPEASITSAIMRGHEVPDHVWEQHQQRSEALGNSRRADVQAANQRSGQMRALMERSRAIGRQRLRADQSNFPNVSFEFMSDYDTRPTATDLTDIVGQSRGIAGSLNVASGLRMQAANEFPEETSSEMSTPFTSRQNVQQLYKGVDAAGAEVDEADTASRPRRNNRNKKKPL